jgi:hypothetical protein
MRTWSVAWIFLLSAAVVPPGVVAQPVRPESLPNPLKPWAQWVLDGAEQRLCPQVAAQPLCLWPGRLMLDVGDRGGRFQLDVFADYALNVRLPGGPKQWPHGVILDGQAAPVLGLDSLPVVRVSAGRHALAGRFEWPQLPDALAAPPEIGLVELIVNGRVVATPKREADGLLVLKQQDGAATGVEDLQLKIFRRLADGIPLWLETRLLVEVSGKAREVRLEGALPKGAVPVAATGDLPARIDPAGALRIQVRPGRFVVTLLGRLDGRPATVGMTAAPAPWPAQEIWVFQSDERLRSVDVSGAPAIDPSRTEIPEEWRELPAYLMKAGATLAIRETRRGESVPPLDQLNLARTIRLDLNGRGFSVRDELAGRLGSTTRLDLKSPGELGRASLNGRDQLVTIAPGRSEGGVEVREVQLALEADSRMPRHGRLPAVGWNAGVQSLRAQLHLPPGWRLFAAPGVDDAPGAWTRDWDLLDFFLIVVTVALAARVLGRRWAVVVLATLVATHAEAGAPLVLWLVVLAVAALRPRATGGRSERILSPIWIVALALLVIAATSFALDQLRTAIFPQEAGRDGDFPTVIELAEELAVGAGGRSRPAAVPVAPPPPAPADEPARQQAEGERNAPQLPEGAEGATEDKTAAFTSSSTMMARNTFAIAKQESYAYDIDPKAVIQTGPGMPAWSWRSYPLGWSGPVDASHTMRLVLLSPAANATLALLRVVLVVLLLIRLAGERVRAWLPRRLSWIASAVAFVVLVPMAPSSAEEAAEAAPAATGGLYPSAELLEEMKARLTRRPPCEPLCVTTARLHLTVAGGELRLEAEVHAGAAAAWSVPGPADAWIPRTVTVGGQPAHGKLARLADGFLHLRLDAGVHRITLAGSLPPVDSVTLQLPDRPQHATASAADWQVDGLHEDGTTDGSIQLTRRVAQAGRGGQADGTYEPWLQVTRVLDVGVAWHAETIVRRISPTGAPIVAKIPLLKGMLVTSAEHQVKDGEVLIALGRDQVETRWSSTLTPVEGQPVVLEAPSGRPWSEVWIVRCGFVWQCEVGGLAPVARLADGRFAPEFRPWPGERLSLTFRRPQGQPGVSLTIDSAVLVVSPGLRLRDVALTLQARASRTSPLVITLPPRAALREVKIDGVVKPARLDGETLPLTLDTGARRVEVMWRELGGTTALSKAPRVELGQPAVNIHVTLKVPEGRWLLLTGGPSWGPRVLFWGYLLLLLVAALVVSRLTTTPLTRTDWMLLAIGLAFARFSFVALAVVFGWFAAVAWRARQERPPGAHNAMQAGLALWTAFFLLLLAVAVFTVLGDRPDMSVSGGQDDLSWYVDRVDGALPRPWALSVPLTVYRVLMLGWALWLLAALVQWLRWAWTSYGSGALWKRREAPAPAPSSPSDRE